MEEKVRERIDRCFGQRGMAMMMRTRVAAGEGPFSPGPMPTLPREGLDMYQIRIGLTGECSRSQENSGKACGHHPVQWDGFCVDSLSVVRHVLARQLVFKPLHYRNHSPQARTGLIPLFTTLYPVVRTGQSSSSSTPLCQGNSSSSSDDDDGGEGNESFFVLSGSRKRSKVHSVPVLDDRGAAAGGSSKGNHNKHLLSLNSIAAHGCVLTTGPEQDGQGHFTLLAGCIQGSVILGDCLVESLQVIEHVQQGGGFYIPYGPVFTNVCGGKSMAGSRHIQEIVFQSSQAPQSSTPAGRGGGGVPRRDPALLSKNITDFGVCYEILSLFGNVAVRINRPGHGSMISFKGAQDARNIFDLLETLYGRDFIVECIKWANKVSPHFGGDASPAATDTAADRCSSDLLYDDFFSVHMAVVTSNIGRKLKVSGTPGILQMCLTRVLGKGVVKIICSLLDDNNTLKFSVQDWSPVIRLANHITLAQSAGPAGAGSAAAGERRCIPESVSKSVRDSSVSITSMGALIIRYSWTPEPLPWNRVVGRDVLETGRALGIVLKECC